MSLGKNTVRLPEIYVMKKLLLFEKAEYCIEKFANIISDQKKPYPVDEFC